MHMPMPFSYFCSFSFATSTHSSAFSLPACIDDVYGESLSLSENAESPSAEAASFAKSEMDVSGAAQRQLDHMRRGIDAQD